MPQVNDWKSWIAIGCSACMVVFIVMVGLNLLARTLKGFRGRMGDKSISIGADHECKQEDLLARMNVRISLLAAGIIALLDHAISQGANGPTARIRDSLIENSDNWQEFTAKKVVAQ